MDQYYLIKEGNYIFIFQILICLIVFYLSLVLIIEIIKKIEETVNLNQTLKELEREKNLKNSLFKITHEVKNPIAVCKGYLSMIDYDNKEKASKYNKIILSEIDRTLDILNNFSEYNKINVLLDIMDLEYLIEETIEEFYELFKEKNIIVNYKEYGEVYISGDYKRLKQVLINCLKNSVEAIIKDGKIDIRLYKKGHNAYFEILDNGCGMNDEELSNIGQLFYTSKEKGCGIGVSLSKEIIKLHGGDIMYKSKKGDYTKVVIRLPLVDLQ